MDLNGPVNEELISESNEISDGGGIGGLNFLPDEHPFGVTELLFYEKITKKKERYILLIFLSYFHFFLNYSDLAFWNLFY
jgi:hypothetical protein